LALNIKGDGATIDSITLRIYFWLAFWK